MKNNITARIRREELMNNFEKNSATSVIAHHLDNVFSIIIYQSGYLIINEMYIHTFVSLYFRQILPWRIKIMLIFHKRY